MKPNIPIYDYRRENELPNFLFSCQYYVWEDANETPALWTFYEESQTLKIETKAGKKYYKWSVLQHSKLLCITEKDHTNTATDELNCYEMWGYKTADYYKLKSVSGQLIYMVKEDIVANMHPNNAALPTKNEIEENPKKNNFMPNNWSPIVMTCFQMAMVYMLYVFLSDVISNPLKYICSIISSFFGDFGADNF